jgi:hypothetical protein
MSILPSDPSIEPSRRRVCCSALRLVEAFETERLSPGGAQSCETFPPDSACRIDTRRTMLAAVRVDWYLAGLNLVVLILQA